ncbi:unnamed protein product [Ectocarpus sp. 4 AP-2014]
MVAVDINDLLHLEAELKTSRERGTSSVSLDAKVNLLKYLQVQTVLQFQEAYDDLCYELNKTGGLDCNRSIAPVRSTGVFQPKIFDLQDCGEDEQLENQLQFYLADAELAKPHLDELVMSVAHDMSKYEVQCVGVKSPESTRRKASRFCDGDVHIAAESTKRFPYTFTCGKDNHFSDIVAAGYCTQRQQVLRLKNGFISDWMPSGYRDVKLNPVVNEHLCEIQLHLHEFFALKGGQHAVYEWAWELNVTTGMRSEDLFKKLSPEITNEMMRLAVEDWRGTAYVLPGLQLAAGQFDLAEKSQRAVLTDAERKLREFEDHDSKESRRALDRENIARSRLAHVLGERGKYEEAETLYRRSLAIDEKVYGPDHPEVAAGLNSWAEFLRSQGKYEEAAPLYVRSLGIREKLYGPDHPEIASSLNNWALLLTSQGKYEEAEPLYVRSLAIREKVLGPDHPDVAISLNNWAGLLNTQESLHLVHHIEGKYNKAEPLYVRSLAIHEKVYSYDHPAVATGLNNWAEVLRNQGKNDEAEPLYQRAQEILEKSLGRDHPDIATVLNNRAVALKNQGKYKEAEPLYVRSLAIDENAHGSDHPAVAADLNNWAGLLRNQGKNDEAEPLYERAQEIWEKSLGRDHPNVATVLNSRARHQTGSIISLAATFQGKYEQAESLVIRSRAIHENAFGPDHPEVAEDPNIHAVLLYRQEKYTEALPLLERALSIRTKWLGENHPHAVETRNTMKVVRKEVRA